MVDFDRLNRETWVYNNGISRNLDPTRGATETYSQKFARPNLETYRYNNYERRYKRQSFMFFMNDTKMLISLKTLAVIL